MPASRPAEDRFWEKVDRSGDCWLWTAVCSNGYGYFWADGKMRPAHRFAYELLTVLIPDGFELDHRHTCPKNCVNPDHLRLATDYEQQQNRPGARADSASGVLGVHWHKKTRKWTAQVMCNGKRHHVGYFTTIRDAEAAVIAKRNELFTHNDLDRQPVN